MNAESIKEILTRKDRTRILVVGDVMLDEYIWGEVERISPEAPVQVIMVNSRDCVLGGAANVAHNLVDLGVDVSLIGIIGKDEGGRKIKEMLKNVELNANGIFEVEGRKTTLKTRVVAHAQQVVRIDEETKGTISKAMEDKIYSYIAEKLNKCDGLIISDYAKGVLTNSLISKIIEACLKSKKGIIVDPKGEDFGRYAGATVITPNLKELENSVGTRILDAKALKGVLDKLMEVVKAEAIIVTKGKDGMTIYEKDGSLVHLEARAQEVYDVSGAGDTAVAALGYALFLGADIETATQIANLAAGVVVGKIGTATVSKNDIIERFDERESKSKIVSSKEISPIVNNLRVKGKKIVFTNGCFDLLHVGHIYLLQRAKSLGDILVIGLNDDDSVRRLKGDNRPLFPQKERARVLLALDCVDFITIFSEDTPIELINLIKPDVLVKGGDYKREEVVGHREVGLYGGKVELIPTVEGSSTTGLIKKIVKKYNN